MLPTLPGVTELTARCKSLGGGEKRPQDRVEAADFLNQAPDPAAINIKALRRRGAKQMNRSESRGFTLIELVVVITILGILAAFAIPKFVALDSQARIATISGLAGSVKSAASLARGLSMATSNAAGPVVMEGATVTLLNSYPDASATGIASAVNSNNGAGGDFTFTAGSGSTTAATWSKNGAPTPAGCAVSYTAPAAGFTPTVVTTTTGC
jgi:MSHA pilin protein MshA